MVHAREMFLHFRNTMGSVMLSAFHWHDDGDHTNLDRSFNSDYEDDQSFAYHNADAIFGLDNSDVVPCKSSSAEITSATSVTRDLTMGTAYSEFGSRSTSAADSSHTYDSSSNRYDSSSNRFYGEYKYRDESTSSSSSSSSLPPDHDCYTSFDSNTFSYSEQHDGSISLVVSDSRSAEIIYEQREPGNIVGDGIRNSVRNVKKGISRVAQFRCGSERDVVVIDDVPTEEFEEYKALEASLPSPTALRNNNYERSAITKMKDSFRMVTKGVMRKVRPKTSSFDRSDMAVNGDLVRNGYEVTAL